MVVAVQLGGCGHARPVASPAIAKVKLAVLPAESDQFPRAAKAATESMSHVQVGGIDETAVSKVSLEVVQLSIECVDASATCYEAIGHSLAANQLLFAQLGAGPTPGQIRVTVTLFDVDAKVTKRTAEKVFAKEAEATAGVAQLVAEATRP